MEPLVLPWYKVVRNTQVAPSGHFLVASINLGHSYSGQEGEGEAQEGLPRKGRCPNVSAKS